MNRFLVLFISIFIFGCTNQTELNEPREKATSNFEKFNIYGQVHNELLRYVSDHFIEPDSVSLRSERIEYILRLQQEGTNMLDLPKEDKRIIKSGLSCYKQLYVTDNVLNQLSCKTRSDGGEGDEEITTSEVKQLIQDAYNQNGIDRFEYESFMELIDCVVANAQGTLLNQKFEAKINSLIRDWEIYYADVDYSDICNPVDNTSPIGNNPPSEDCIVPPGAFSGVVLNISRSSVEYWKSEDVDYVQTRSAAGAFIGADIAGAVIGACSCALSQYTLNGEVSDWKSMLWSAGTGAVVASTGIAGRIGRWLSKFI